MKLQVAMFVLASGICYANAQASNELVFAELGGVQLVSKPVDLGSDDYQATIVELRAIDPVASLITFTNISITGEVAQLHGTISSALSPEGNAFKEMAGALYREEWGTIDTHLLIQKSSIAGGYFGVLEANDGSYGYGGFPNCAPAFHATAKCSAGPKAGIGPIHFTEPTDAFFLFPEFQQNSMDYAYIVTPVSKASKGEVRMTLGLLGSGIINAGEEGGAAFGYDGNPDVIVPFAVPEPSSWLILMMGWLGLVRLHAVSGSKFARSDERK